jgi:hypothetical protein
MRVTAACPRGCRSYRMRRQLRSVCGNVNIWFPSPERCTRVRPGCQFWTPDRINNVSSSAVAPGGCFLKSLPVRLWKCFSNHKAWLLAVLSPQPFHPLRLHRHIQLLRCPLRTGTVRSTLETIDAEPRAGATAYHPRIFPNRVNLHGIEAMRASILPVHGNAVHQSSSEPA